MAYSKAVLSYLEPPERVSSGMDTEVSNPLLPGQRQLGRGHVVDAGDSGPGSRDPELQAAPNLQPGAVQPPAGQKCSPSMPSNMVANVWRHWWSVASAMKELNFTFYFI